MRSNTPNNDIQNELENLSPLLAHIRAQTANKPAKTDMDALHAMGHAALAEVSGEDIDESTSSPTLKVVHRKRKWLGLVAAAVALFIGSFFSYSIYSSSEVPDPAFTSSTEALSQELIASFEAETADPIAFLLDDETTFDEESDLYFSPAEDVLLDWADDGFVDEALSEEMMFDAVW